MMGEILLWVAVLFVSLFFLVKSADYFTDAAEKIGLYLGLSSFIVGATIVSVGSSMPELATSVLAVMGGKTSFALENVIGSNIANCLLVGGVCAIVVGTLKVKQKLIDVDLPFFFISSALFLLFLLDGKFTYIEGILSLILLLIFVFYTISIPADPADLVKKPKSIKKPILILVASSLGIYFAAKYTVNSVLEVADILKIESGIVTMIAVAIGTSLPELIVSVRAAKAGKHSIALGNIFGSNTFNVLGVAGVASFFADLEISTAALKIGIPFFIVTSLAFIFVSHDDEIKKWEGMALLLVYVAFCGKLVGLF